MLMMPFILLSICFMHNFYYKMDSMCKFDGFMWGGCVGDLINMYKSKFILGSRCLDCFGDKLRNCVFLDGHRFELCFSFNVAFGTVLF